VLAAGTVVAVLLAPWLIALLYGPRYETATGVLRLLFAANAIGSVGLLLVPVGLRLGHTRLVAMVGVVQFAVNLGGDLLWIPPYGAMGSAAATLLMHVAGTSVLAAGIGLTLRRRGGDALATHIG
jgi:PST family polysaccharide transporter